MDSLKRFRKELIKSGHKPNRRLRRSQQLARAAVSTYLTLKLRSRDRRPASVKHNRTISRYLQPLRKPRRLRSHMKSIRTFLCKSSNS